MTLKYQKTERTSTYPPPLGSVLDLIKTRKRLKHALAGEWNSVWATFDAIPEGVQVRSSASKLNLIEEPTGKAGETAVGLTANIV